MLEPHLDPILFRNLAIALFIGALVGVDREHKAATSPTFGGLRTFMLIALAGATTAWLGQVLALPWLVGVGLASLGVLLSAAYVAGSGQSVQGLTGEMAAFVVYLLGALCVVERPEVAVVLGITTSGLLAFKQPLHSLVQQVGPDDLAATLKLLFATFIVLPLLPDAPVDPFGALNPYKLWWLVILVSALSLLGYVAVRGLGERSGMALTGLFGGLVSSTAVTVSAARRSTREGENPNALAMSILLAWTVMFARVVLEVLVVQPTLVPRLAVPMAAMGFASLIAAAWFGTRPHDASALGEVTLRNPFSLLEAIKFGGVFAAVKLVVVLGEQYLGSRALYGVAALAGTTDVDAITLSVADPVGGTPADVARTVIVIAVLSNTAIKCGLVVFGGGRALAARVAAATGIIGTTGLLAVAFA